MFKHVKFRIRNTTDGYWLTATRDEATGIYYVTGHVTEEADGTVFFPVTVGDEYGKVVIKGVEDDSYEIYEIETANGYTLLKDEIKVDIFVEENYDRICDIYTKDVLGVLQNDPHYCFGNAGPLSITEADGGADLHLTGIPQDYLEHYFLTAFAQVDGNDVNMEDDGRKNIYKQYVCLPSNMNGAFCQVIQTSAFPPYTPIMHPYSLFFPLLLQTFVFFSGIFPVLNNDRRNPSFPYFFVKKVLFSVYLPSFGVSRSLLSVTDFDKKLRFNSQLSRFHLVDLYFPFFYSFFKF